MDPATEDTGGSFKYRVSNEVGQAPTHSHRIAPRIIASSVALNFQLSNRLLVTAGRTGVMRHNGFSPGQIDLFSTTVL
jgi:hypothetical protein